MMKVQKSFYVKEVNNLKFKKSDLKPDGNISIIFSADTVSTINDFRESLTKKNIVRDVETFEIIPAFMGKILPEKLEQLQSVCPSGVTITVDRKISTEPQKNFKEFDLDKDDSRLNAAISTIGLDRVHSMGYTGKGVGIAVIDSGIDRKHKDFEGRIVEFVDYIGNKNGKDNAYDDYGHGTAVSGCSLGNGASSNGLYKGAAPEANLISLKISNYKGEADTSNAIKAVEWCIKNKDKFNIKVINLSMSDRPSTSYKNDPLSMAFSMATRVGIASVCSAGNTGPLASTIRTPGFNPDVITVGAYDDKNTVTHADDDMYAQSSHGPTPFDNLDKPDFIAPGVNIVAPLSKPSYYSFTMPTLNPFYLKGVSGTSLSAPIVAGLIAVLFQANPGMTPDKVKDVLTKTSVKISNYDKYTQGAGSVDAPKALGKAIAGV